MALVDMKAMLQHAHAHGYAVGGFDVADPGFVAGVVRAAQHCASPVILSVDESHVACDDLEALMPALEAAAKRAPVPVAIHLDRGAGLDSAVRAIRLGCTGVVIDASEEPLETNIARTRQVVDMAHGCGVPVEGGIAHAELAAVIDYVVQTGVDMLAVSVGTAHGRMQGGPDFERIAAINDALHLPLAIRAGTGLDEAQFRGLIERGVARINVHAFLADAAASAVRAQAAAGTSAPLFGCVRDAIAVEAERCMRLWGSAGRAGEVLSHCPAWEPVEHLITYNVEPGHDVEAMIAEGRRVLAAVPGVRSVAAGEAVAVDAARYRYCWLVRFASAAVIDSYRHHPLHSAYADTYFRPAAPDRMSIDYRLFAEGEPHA